MRIMMTCDVALEGTDGQTSHILELFNNLNKLTQVYLFSPKSNINIIKIKNSKYILKLAIPKLGVLVYEISLFLKLAYYCNRIGFDIIYTRISNLTIIPLIISKICGIPFVVEVNGFLIRERKESYPYKFDVNLVLTKLCEIINYKYANKIIVVTQNIKKEIRKTYNVTDEKIVVIENGANTDLFRPMSREGVMNELNLNGNYNYIGFSGSFADFHGLDDLLKSAPLVLKKKSNTKFIFVGDGLMKESIIQMVKDLNLMDNFVFINRVPYEEVPRYINAFDVCVILKKKDIPGSSLKLWEYMACGKPVVATNTQDYKVLEDCNAGILVDPEKPKEVADAIVTLLKNKELREEMGKNGRKTVVKNHSWECVARDVEKVIGAVVEKKVL